MFQGDGDAKVVEASSIKTVFEVVPFALHVSSCVTKDVFKFLWKGGGFEGAFLEDFK